MTRLVPLALMGLLAAPAQALDLTAMSEAERKAFREEVRAYLLDNPEVIMEAVAVLEDRKAAAQETDDLSLVRANAEAIFNDGFSWVGGNPEGDVTVVEFFDYNCPYCRRAMAEVEGLVEDDENVRLVYREWPILGEGSVFAARAALASREQGKYEEFHLALMGMQGRAEEASVMRIAEEIGLDVEKLRADMAAPEVDEHIATSRRLTQALGFNGTPSFVIGDNLVPGFVEQEQLGALVEQVRGAAQ